MLRAVIVILASSLALACAGYSDTSPEPAPRDDTVLEPPRPSDRVRQEDAGARLVSASDASLSDDSEVVAVAVPIAVDTPNDKNLRLGQTPRFAGYLMDQDERPLYMFAEDVAGSAASTCLDACVKDWPPFDLKLAAPEPGILINEVTRFHRQDGRWQSAYKGHPLYYRATEVGGREITGDAVDGRWFVARDYLAFISISKSFAPAGSETFGAGFLTNGFGRALYVCFDDTPAVASTPALSSCTGECLRRRPLWSVSEAGRTTILPSVIKPDDLSELVRPDGAVQLLLRGWPVYYFSGDESWGDTQGQNQNAWRAIDPANFGKQVAEQLLRN
jgi:predicted lipoprotein with Yx(FWY)xxD motif